MRLLAASYKEFLVSISITGSAFTWSQRGVAAAHGDDQRIAPRGWALECRGRFPPAGLEVPVASRWVACGGDRPGRRAHVGRPDPEVRVALERTLPRRIVRDPRDRALRLS